MSGPDDWDRKTIVPLEMARSAMADRLSLSSSSQGSPAILEGAKKG